MAAKATRNTSRYKSGTHKHKKTKIIKKAKILTGARTCRCPQNHECACPPIIVHFVLMRLQ
jgi:hypothetical protein